MRQLTSRIWRTMAATVLATSAFTLAACHHHHHRHSGPVEHAGHHVDHAADKAGDAIEGTGRAINRALPGD